MRTIMVATDGSDGACRAVDIAAEIAKATNGTLSILTVGRVLSVQEQEQVRKFSRIEGESAHPGEALAQRVLDDAKDRARRVGIDAPKVSIVWGDPAQAIIEAIQRDNADAVVVGRRGHGPLTSLLLGSVSQKLVSLAPCVVIVAP